MNKSAAKDLMVYIAEKGVVDVWYVSAAWVLSIKSEMDFICLDYGTIVTFEHLLCWGRQSKGFVNKTVPESLPNY